jgi:hypothetical protein
MEVGDREIEQQNDGLQRDKFLFDHGQIDRFMKDGDLLNRLHPLGAPRRYIACYEDFEDGRPMTRHHVSLEPFQFRLQRQRL